MMLSMPSVLSWKVNYFLKSYTSYLGSDEPVSIYEFVNQIHHTLVLDEDADTIDEKIKVWKKTLLINLESES
jgi:hypothetical protein